MVPGKTPRPEVTTRGSGVHPSLSPQVREPEAQCLNAPGGDSRSQLNRVSKSGLVCLLISGALWVWMLTHIDEGGLQF